VVLARWAASGAGVRGSRSRAVWWRMRARPAGVTLPGLPTIAYRSGRPCQETAAVPATTRGLAAATARR
jgi:hypothetical protein